MEDVCLDVAIDPVCLDGSIWLSFEFTIRLGDPESAGAARVDSVRAQSGADFREAEVVVANNAAVTETDTPGINGGNFLGSPTRRGLFMDTGVPRDPESAGAAEIDFVRS